MEINHRQQQKHLLHKTPLWIDLLDGTKKDISFLEVELVMKDVCFIRNELTNYVSINASQLDFQSHLNLPYWEYLFINGSINQSDKDEVEEGVLLIVYLLYAEVFEDENIAFITTEDILASRIQQHLSVYKPNNTRKEKIINCINFCHTHYLNERLGDDPGVEQNENDRILRKQLDSNREWVYLEFVENYYIEKANSFETNRLQAQAFFESLIAKSKG